MDEVRIAPVDPDAEAILQQWLVGARSWGVDVQQPSSIESAYDDYLTEVAETPAAQRQDPTAHLTMVAMAMGEHLARNSPWEWRVVTDAKGTDLALVSPDGKNVLYPIDPVADGWSQKRIGWIVAFIADIGKQLRAAP